MPSWWPSFRYAQHMPCKLKAQSEVKLLKSYGVPGNTKMLRAITLNGGIMDICISFSLLKKL